MNDYSTPFMILNAAWDSRAAFNNLLADEATLASLPRLDLKILKYKFRNIRDSKRRNSGIADSIPADPAMPIEQVCKLTLLGEAYVDERFMAHAVDVLFSGILNLDVLKILASSVLLRTITLPSARIALTPTLDCADLILGSLCTRIGNDEIGWLLRIARTK